ncbi:DUF3592 domain-containing protein [Dactylosporangium sp. NPDC049742]|uniref:DUF3592 domain-containing protein n=1 Tax=Dactylosporangium sp. NPDC049742 TaxID=3154737 RepID=UPI00341B2987
MLMVGFVVMLLIGVVHLVKGVRSSGSDRRFLARAVRVPGVVVDVSWDFVPTAAGVQLGMPVFQYHTREGRPMRATDPVGANPPRFRPGTPVAVLYDPKAPHVAKLEANLGTGKGLNMLSAIGGTAAAIAGLIGLVVMLSE